MKLMTLALIGAIAIAAGCIGQSQVPAEELPRIFVTAGAVLAYNFTEDSWLPAVNGSAIPVGSRIKTLQDSAAEIIFFDGAVLRLDADTEITITSSTRDSVEVYQPSGRTWSRILSIAGIQDYKVQTPTAIASVRGTAFAVDVDEDTIIFVDEGTVNVSSYDLEEGAVAIADSEVLKEGEGAEIDYPGDIVIEVLNETETEELAPEIIDWVDENVAEDIEFVEELAQEGIIDEAVAEEIIAEDIAQDAKEVPLNDVIEQPIIDEGLPPEEPAQENVTDVITQDNMTAETINQLPAVENTTKNSTTNSTDTLRT